MSMKIAKSTVKQQTSCKEEMGYNPNLDIFPARPNLWENIVGFFQGGFCNPQNETKKKIHVASDDDFRSSSITSISDCGNSAVAWKSCSKSQPSIKIVETMDDLTWNSSSEDDPEATFGDSLRSQKITEIVTIPTSSDGQSSSPKPSMSSPCPKDMQPLKSILKNKHPGPIHKIENHRDYKKIFFVALCSASTIGMKHMFDNFFHTPNLGDIVVNSAIEHANLHLQDIDIGRPKFIPKEDVDAGLVDEKQPEKTNVSIEDEDSSHFFVDEENSTKDSPRHPIPSYATVTDSFVQSAQHSLIKLQDDHIEGDDQESCYQEAQEATRKAQHIEIEQQGLIEDEDSTSSVSLYVKNSTEGQHVDIEEDETDSLDTLEIDTLLHALEDKPRKSLHDYTKEEKASLEKNAVTFLANQVLNKVDDQDSLVQKGLVPINAQHVYFKKDNALTIITIDQDKKSLDRTNQDIFNFVFQRVKKKIELLSKAIQLRFKYLQIVTKPIWKYLLMKLGPALEKVAPAFKQMQRKFSILLQKLSQHLERKMM